MRMRMIWRGIMSLYFVLWIAVVLPVNGVLSRPSSASEIYTKLAGLEDVRWLIDQYF